jgi:flavin-dependent dehydrogenase
LAKTNTQVLIIGAGPAGTATAIQCAAVGLDVTIVEREPFPRHRPGESLHPGVDCLFARLDVTEAIACAGFPRHEGHWLSWAGKRRFEAYGRDAQGPWQGFQAWRADLDQILLQRAVALGTQVLQPCRCIAPLTHGGRLAGLTTSSGAITASYIVDASGGSHWLARHIGLAVVKESPRLIARYGYARGDLKLRNRMPSLVSSRHGWTWTAMVQRGVYHWTRLNLDGKTSARPPHQFRGLMLDGSVRSADVTWRRIMRPAGPGYFLAGDAAMVLDPASSHGVLRAVMSGMMAGHLIVGTIQHRSSPAEAASWYCGWLHQWFEHDQTQLKASYAQLPNPPDWVRDASHVLA